MVISVSGYSLKQRTNLSKFAFAVESVYLLKRTAFSFNTNLIPSPTRTTSAPGVRHQFLWLACPFCYQCPPATPPITPPKTAPAFLPPLPRLFPELLNTAPATAPSCSSLRFVVFFTASQLVNIDL
jgi:hypothetical protein